ncbi:MAG TPA: diaminopimelate decarboxylase [Lacipirellulaceae bacterium]|nr:diaminopimelate decarboxylase [Lacipirellulaceae bacterium]
MPTTAAEYPTTIEAVAGQPVVELAERFGTPLFVYDAAVIAERIADLASFDVVRFAQKANSNLAVLDLVRRRGGVVDAVSAGEIRRAMAAGFKAGGVELPPGEHPEIVYTADIFDRETLQLVVELGVPVNCGSPDMIEQYGQALAQSGRAAGPSGSVAGITLRINPGFGHGHSQKTNTGGEQSKHGIWHEQLDHCVALARRYQLSISALHMHIGSGTDLEHLSHVCGAMEAACLKVGASIHSISAGGGLPTPYRDGDQRVDLSGYFELWDAARRRLAAAYGHAVSLEIEPGRYLVAESGALIAEIRTVKRMGGNLFYLLDAGFNNLARPILYGAYHPMAVAYNAGSEPGRPRPRQGATHPVIVGGPLCESGDIFTQEDGGYVRARDLPQAAVGDYLVIGATGAYGAVMGNNYNSKPLAAEVLVESGEVHLVRQRQVFDDLIRGEHIPRT